MANSTDYIFLGWQLPESSHSVSHNLGMSDWGADETWLQSEQSRFSLPVIIVLKLQQTPTGELADCIELLRVQNPDISVGILRLADASKRDQGLYKSWLYFGEQYDVELINISGAKDE